MVARYRLATVTILSSLAAILLMVLGSGPAQALMLKLDLAALVNGSDYIATGPVTGVECRWNTQHNLIYTLVTFSAADNFKGSLPSSPLTILVRGGTVDNTQHIVSDTPVFAQGQSVLLFLRQMEPEEIAAGGWQPQGAAYYAVYAGWQGKLDIRDGKAGNVTIEALRAAIDTISQGGSSALNVDDLRLEERPAIRYDYSLGHHWNAASMTYRVNASGDRLAAVNSAANTWNNAGANFGFVYGGTHSNPGTTMSNGVNEIAWGTLTYETDLATTFWSVEPGTNHILEADIRFNINKTWTTSNPTVSNDVESIALHELGHCLELDHSTASGAVMNETYTGIKRALTGDDMAGIRFIYGASANAVPLPPNLSAPADNPPVNSSTINFSWTAGDALATNYRIRVSLEETCEGGGYFHEDTTGGAVSRQYTDCPNNDAILYWKVQAYNANGWGQWSPIGHVHNGPNYAPGSLPPGDLSAAAQGPNQINLAWNPWYDRYTMIRCRTDGVWPTGPLDGTQVFYGYYMTSSYQHLSLTPNTRYLYRAWSYQGVAYSPNFTQLSAYTPLSDIPLAIDWNGDGIQEMAIFRSRSPDAGKWFIDLNHSGKFDTGDVQLGVFGSTAGDKPLAIDWDGSGTQELAVFRPSAGMWYIDTSRNGKFGTGDLSFGPFGTTAGDTPLAIDWNGDGRQELAIFRPSTGMWYVDTSRNGKFGTGDLSFGPFGTTAGDIPLAIDWNGDNRQELCIFRPSTGIWYIDTSRNGKFGSGDVQLGPFGTTQFDKPVAIDWDGGQQEACIVRTCGSYYGYWYIDLNHSGMYEGGDLTRSRLGSR